MRSIDELFGQYCGKTAWIVGKGPSLAWASSNTFGEGPVIAINGAISLVERLGLPNPLFSMQKDSCGQPGICLPGGHKCPENTLMRHDRVRPKRATLLVSWHESRYCLEDYEPRLVFNAVEDLAADNWFATSGVCCILLAKRMGCGAVRLVSFDAMTCGDLGVSVGALPDSPQVYFADDSAMIWHLPNDSLWIEPQNDGTSTYIQHEIQVDG